MRSTVALWFGKMLLRDVTFHAESYECAASESTVYAVTDMPVSCHRDTEKTE